MTDSRARHLLDAVMGRNVTNRQQASNRELAWLFVGLLPVLLAWLIDSAAPWIFTFACLWRTVHWNRRSGLLPYLFDGRYWWPDGTPARSASPTPSDEDDETRSG